jgi:FixJ family two-component response regulator
MSSAAISRGYPLNSAQVLGPGFKSSFVSDTTPIVFVLDEDPSVRESLELLIRREGWQSEIFASAQEFLAHPRASVPNCLVLDVSHSELNGLDLQKRAATERPDMPIIFIANNVDIPTAVQAMKAGAVGVFMKPPRETALLSSILEALERSRVAIAHEAEMQPLRDCYSSLSRREREVMALVVAGLLNKQVGSELGISEITVKAHRGQVMQKMKANSLAGLVKMAARLGLASGSKN